MQTGQLIRRFSARMRAGFAALASQGASSWPKIKPKLNSLTLRRAGVIAVVVLALYYTVGALLAHKIDDDPDFTTEPGSVLEGESLAVSLAIGLLDREVNDNGWVANSPFYLPSALLHNMASFQTGIVETIERFSATLGHVLADRGIRSVDLDVTASRLSKRPDIWSWNPTEPWGYLGTSEREYREALLDLQGYNVGLTDNTSQFPKDAAALAILLARFSRQLQEAAHALEQEADYRAVLLSRRVGDAFYRARGISYCQMILLRGLLSDYAAIVRERSIGDDWARAESALLRAATYSPLFVVNGDPDGVLLPSHPLTETFYLADAQRALDSLGAKLN